MWIETIVMPREETRPPRPSPKRDRMTVARKACAEGEQFRDAVVTFLHSRKLMGAVKWISEPGSLPMVTLHCETRVLEQLQKDPQFAAGRSMSMSLPA
jgi:hypothetical protein